jgi:hypothetical protein
VPQQQQQQQQQWHRIFVGTFALGKRSNKTTRIQPQKM